MCLTVGVRHLNKENSIYVKTKSYYHAFISSMIIFCFPPSLVCFAFDT